MRRWISVAALLTILVLAGVTACNPFSGDNQAAAEQPVEVVRGDLTISVSGSGNTELADEMKLTFGIAGRIDKLYVDEGDNVSQGMVLAKLDTDDLELALTKAQSDYAQAKLAVDKAEVAVTQAEVSRDTAQFDLEEAQEIYADVEILQARTAVSDASNYLKYAQNKLDQAKTANDINRWSYEVDYAKEKLRTAEVTLNQMLAVPDTREVAVKRLQVDLAESNLELAKKSLEPTQQALELARQSVEQARRQLEKATITAPFDGIVASVPVDEQDTVSTTVPIIHLIDPDSLELKVQVDEIDIPDVKVGQRAIIEVDALPDRPIDGEVTFISLLPTKEAGVTVYDVKIKFNVSADIGLKAGMSATADIITADRTSVLLVPERAITQDNQGKPVVEVMVNGQATEVAVVTGISDGYQVEIVSGLEEGDKVVEKGSKPK